MLKRFLSIILLTVFANFIVAPTIVSLVDNTADVSVVFSLNEEENNKKESEQDKEIKILQLENPYDSFMDFSGKIVKFCKENYSKHHLKLHLPPPELS